MSSKEVLSIALGIALVFVSISAALHVRVQQRNAQELTSAQMNVLPMMSRVGNLRDQTPVEAYYKRLRF